MRNIFNTADECMVSTYSTKHVNDAIIFSRRGGLKESIDDDGPLYCSLKRVRFIKSSKKRDFGRKPTEYDRYVNIPVMALTIYQTTQLMDSV